MTEALVKKLQADSAKMEEMKKDREKTIMNRQQLESQLTENNMVNSELERLPDDALIYKLMGPALVRQQVVDAKMAVSRRLQFINNECGRVDTSLDDMKKGLEAMQTSAMNTQQTLQQAYIKEQQLQGAKA